MHTVATAAYGSVIANQLLLKFTLVHQSLLLDVNGNCAHAFQASSPVTSYDLVTKYPEAPPDVVL